MGDPAIAQVAIEGRVPYVASILLTGIGLYVLVADDHLVKKVVGLNVFQTGIFLFFVLAAYREGGRAPLLSAPGPYVDPLPHVLVLTAIVVGVSVTAVALALVVRLHREYGTLREAVIDETIAAREGRHGGNGP
jgi:multicomponent Na+:H+ antiporter subunit C